MHIVLYTYPTSPKKVCHRVVSQTKMLRRARLRSPSIRPDRGTFNHPSDQCPSNHPSDQCPSNHPSGQCPFNQSFALEPLQYKYLH